MRGAIMAGAVLLAAGCHGGDDGPGRQIRRNVQVGAFDKLSLAGSHDVVVTVGGAPSVRLEGDSKRIDRMEVVVEGGTLKIRTKDGHSGFSLFFSHDRKPVTVYVTTPALAEASIAGSGDIRIDKVGGDFQGAIAGSGDLQIGAMQGRTANFAIAGSGNVRVSGKVESAEFAIAGSGDIAAGGLEARRAKIRVAGSGNVEARAMETADIDIKGSGDVVVTGTAKCTIDKKGSGEARCGG